VEFMKWLKGVFWIFNQLAESAIDIFWASGAMEVRLFQPGIGRSRMVPTRLLRNVHQMKRPNQFTAEKLHPTFLVGLYNRQAKPIKAKKNTTERATKIRKLSFSSAICMDRSGNDESHAKIIACPIQKNRPQAQRSARSAVCQRGRDRKYWIMEALILRPIPTAIDDAVGKSLTLVEGWHKPSEWFTNYKLIVYALLVNVVHCRAFSWSISRVIDNLNLHSPAFVLLTWENVRVAAHAC
jgi:hypothetical protein